MQKHIWDIKQKYGQTNFSSVASVLFKSIEITLTICLKVIFSS